VIEPQDTKTLRNFCPRISAKSLDIMKMFVSLMMAACGIVVHGQSAPHEIPHGPIAQAQVQAPQRQGPQGQRRSENLFYHDPSYDFFSGGGYPGFYGGGAFNRFHLSPQQNGDGSWNFVALPIPLENQTIPDGFARDEVAQAKLWGPIYKPGEGWVYGEAGNILVPRNPPYAPPRFVTPPALAPRTSSPTPSPSSPIKDTAEIDTKTGKILDKQSLRASSKRIERLIAKPERK